MTDINRERGTVYYDASCSLCTDLARRFGPLLMRHGFRLAPLQTPGLQERLRIPAETLLDEMRLVTSSGQVLGGADAILHIARYLWWARPLRLVAWLPGGGLRAPEDALPQTRAPKCCLFFSPLSSYGRRMVYSRGMAISALLPPHRQNIFTTHMFCTMSKGIAL